VYEPALAASCGKGMLWPYVRNPGDCLTDTEIKAGQSGVYSGPVNTNPDISGVRVQAPTQNGPVTATTPAPTQIGPVTATPPAPSAPTSVRAPATAPAKALTSVSPNGVRTTIGGAQHNDEVACRKGVLWPFRREPGDCLTTAEKDNGQTGVYGGGTGITTASAVTVPQPGPVNAQPPSPPAATSASAPPAANGPATASADTTVETPTAGCRKGLLWPFVRRAGDCPTTAEQKQGR